LFPAANDLSISDNNMGSIDEPGEDSGTTFQRLEIYLSNINVEKIFLIADNSGLIVIWKTYYHGTSYIIPETSTQSTKRTFVSYPFSLTSTESHFPFSKLSFFFFLYHFSYWLIDSEDEFTRFHSWWLSKLNAPRNFSFRCIIRNKSFYVLFDNALCLVSYWYNRDT